MFQVTRNGENRLDVQFSGKLDRAEMNAAFDELNRQAEGIEHGRLLYRIDDLKMPTLGAIGVEVSRLLQMLRFVRRFERMAVVADKEWIRTASEIEGALMPGLTIKAFKKSQTEGAEAWLQH